MIQTVWRHRGVRGTLEPRVHLRLCVHGKVQRVATWRRAVVGRRCRGSRRRCGRSCGGTTGTLTCVLGGNGNHRRRRWAGGRRRINTNRQSDRQCHRQALHVQLALQLHHLLGSVGSLLLLQLLEELQLLQLLQLLKLLVEVLFVAGNSVASVW